jgi:hypothetical protein
MSYSIEKTLSLDFESKLQFESTSQIPSPNFELSRVDFLNKIISCRRGFILFTPFFWLYVLFCALYNVLLLSSQDAVGATHGFLLSVGALLLLS